MQVLEYAAFSTDPSGGNPAGIVLDADALDDTARLSLAARLGHSESAFVVAGADPAAFTVRYFSPLAEVDFCGHATIATAVALAQRGAPERLTFHTNVGPIGIVTRVRDAITTATLTSVEPRGKSLDEGDLDALRTLFGWTRADLDPHIPTALAYAGEWHPVLPLRSRDTLASMRYDFDRLGALMADRHWITVQVVHRDERGEFHSRNPFPPGGVVEDPATGAAAAALGGHLRTHGVVTAPADVVIHQGVDLGRPSRIDVHIPERGGIGVTGAAVDIGTVDA